MAYRGGVKAFEKRMEDVIQTVRAFKECMRDMPPGDPRFAGEIAYLQSTAADMRRQLRNFELLAHDFERDFAVRRDAETMARLIAAAVQELEADLEHRMH